MPVRNDAPVSGDDVARAPGAYDEALAAVYDADFVRDDLDATVDALVELAGDRPVLELAVGTGRIALPLRARGVDITGMDASPAMVARLRAKPRGTDVPVVLGDMADISIEGEFGVIFVAWNSLFCLPDQASQVRCFASAAAHLASGGVFVVESFVADFSAYVGGQRVTTTRVEGGIVRLGASVHFPADQVIETAHITLSNAGAQVHPMTIRYAQPAELDLMAQVAGLELVDRWGSWAKAPFTNASRSAVSIWRKP